MEEIAVDVLIRAAEGEMRAFEEVYKATSSFVYNVALRVSQNSADAEEITQDVFMKIYRNLKKFRFRSAFKTWVYRITVNTAINHYRKSRKEEKDRVDYETISGTLAGNSSSADEAIRDDNEQRLKALLDKLKPKYKICLILREIERLSYEEIAVILNIPINTVRSRLKRAREALLGEARRGLVKDAV
ncbi:MAG: sigma-70 family RNA polymerase sigma factor [Candidatus Omnitrophica bacterium]|nr:sigma-70 family RNA polymerase sigma factor [Candidatus Omnitrophota bacterium]